MRYPPRFRIFIRRIRATKNKIKIIFFHNYIQTLLIFLYTLEILGRIWTNYALLRKSYNKILIEYFAFLEVSYLDIDDVILSLSSIFVYRQFHVDVKSVMSARN